MPRLTTLYKEPASKFVAELMGDPKINMMEAQVLEIDKKVYVALSDNIKLELPEKKQKKLEKYIGKEVYFGIRPEKIKIINDKNNIGLFNAKIEKKIEKENRNYYYFVIQNKEIVMETSIDRKLEINKEPNLIFDLEYCHIFDKKTEENITRNMDYIFYNE